MRRGNSRLSPSPPSTTGEAILVIFHAMGLELENRKEANKTESTTSVIIMKRLAEFKEWPTYSSQAEKI
jgi:hypothetical protein